MHNLPEYLKSNQESVILVAIGILLAIYLAIRVFRHIGLEKIRGKVYQLFLEAEHEFQYGDNEEKFEYVINLARAAIPSPFNLFITETLLRKVVQAWFDMIKDLLDDGKLNKSSEEREDVNHG